MPGQSYLRRLRSLLLCCDVVRALINSRVGWFCTSALGLVLFQTSDSVDDGSVLPLTLYIVRGCPTADATADQKLSYC